MDFVLSITTLQKQITSRHLSSANVVAFRRLVYKFYKTNRRSFPWRNTVDPYRIMVSELMLQQTQTDRVVPKYQAFIKRFPSAKALAKAPFRDVVSLWQGLGYNRRALYLHKASQAIVQNHRGRFPKEQSELINLPGIGPYTAAAIGAFAFNQPTIVLETNIRTVFIYTFFATRRGKVSDQQLVPLLEQTLDRKNPRQWYSALMDFGAHIKKEIPNPSRRSKHHQTQSTFAGSDRQVRGEIIRQLTAHPSLSQAELGSATKIEPVRLKKILAKLVSDGMLVTTNKRYFLA